jgi:phosphoglycerate dehydrogenase-like enzyme
LSPPVVEQQWAHLEGVGVVQAPWAGVDALRHIFPPPVTLCNARGVHDIPTAEWAVEAILAMQKSLPFYVEQQNKRSLGCGPAGAADRGWLAQQNQESTGTYA